MSELPDDGETRVLACARTSREGAPLEGSVVKQCVQCGEDVWASPASMALGEKFPIVIGCLECVYEFAEENEVKVEIHKEQIDELKDSLKKEAH